MTVEMPTRTRREALAPVVLLVFMASILLGSCGRFDWLAAWVAIAIVSANQLFIYCVVRPKNPGLTEKHITSRWDRLLYPLISLYFPVCTWIVAGLDNRFGWTGQQPLFVKIAALLITIFGLSLSTWAMLSNKFYALTEIIQSHRGHEVAMSGPYKYVRHPSYTGGILFYLSFPVWLGSVWALIPGGCASFLIIIRAILEDRMLRKSLEGYNTYARRVRYYMLPGIW